MHINDYFGGVKCHESVRIPNRRRYTTLCDKDCQWLAAGQWFSPGIPVSSTNKTDRHNITEILLKVANNIVLSSGQNPIWLESLFKLDTCTCIIDVLFVYLMSMVWFGFMVLNATFNNISVILWLHVQCMLNFRLRPHTHRH
jgi:hypothetical protein